MIDKFLKIGIGLGTLSTVGSIIYWSTQYEKYMPFYKPKSIPKIILSGRSSNPNYLKIKDIEEKVGCKFFVIVDKEKKAYGLLKEEKINDEMLENLSLQFDGDEKIKGSGTDILTIENLKNQCKAFGSFRKSLRISREEIKEAEGRVSFQFKSRRNNQGPDYSQVE